MSFQKTAFPNSIRLDDGHILTAAVQTADQDFYPISSIDLNTCLGNLNGMSSFLKSRYPHPYLGGYTPTGLRGIGGPYKAPVLIKYSLLFRSLHLGRNQLLLHCTRTYHHRVGQSRKCFLASKATEGEWRVYCK